MEFNDLIDKIYNMDCVEGMKQIPDNSIDLVVTDPPYYKVMRKDWAGTKYDWDNQWKDFNEYLTWMEKIGIEIKRVSKSNASLYIFADAYYSSHIRFIFEKLGYSLLNEIIWVKKNNMTNKGWTGYRRYAPITERLLFFGSAESEYETAVEGIIDKVYQPLREYLVTEKDKVGITLDDVNSLVGTTSMAGRHYFASSQWCFPTREHYERMQLTFNAVFRKLGTITEIGSKSNEELISILRKDYDVLRKDYDELRKDYDELRRYFRPKENFTDVWISNLTNSSDNQLHPTQKPEWMLQRIIDTSCKLGGLVLDPFMGSGTTAVACRMLNRHFIGFEISKEYCDIANNRLKKYMEQTNLTEVLNNGN